MTEDEFWKLIEESVEIDRDGEVRVERLEQALARQPPGRIVEFARQFDEVYYRSYTWEIWGAAYLINGGCSDDGFDYFRGWLIAQGREVVERALENPDSLADVAEEDVMCSDILYSAMRAYEQVTGGELPSPPRGYPDLGDGWDFDDDGEMQRRYPRLFAKFCGAG